MKQHILDEIKDYDSKARKPLELITELTSKLTAVGLIQIEGTKSWQGQAYKALSEASKEELAAAEKLLEKNYELAAHLMCILHVCCMTIRTAEAYRQKALTVAAGLGADISRKTSEADAFASLDNEAAKLLMEKLKARFGVKAPEEGKTL